MHHLAGQAGGDALLRYGRRIHHHEGRQVCAARGVLHHWRLGEAGAQRELHPARQSGDRGVTPLRIKNPLPPAGEGEAGARALTTLLQVENLAKHYPVLRRGVFRRRETGAIRAVDDVSFTVDTGESCSAAIAKVSLAQ